MALVNGCIMQPIYLEWFRYSTQVIPPARPVGLIEDGHAFDISIGLIELTCENNIHLCTVFLSTLTIISIHWTLE